nr:MAG TPA: hypothetical protein [Caudoviricetes sp.]
MASQAWEAGSIPVSRSEGKVLKIRCLWFLAPFIRIAQPISDIPK